MAHAQTSDGSQHGHRSAKLATRWPLAVVGLILTELGILSVAHTFFGFIFVCRDVAPSILCELLSGSVGRAIAFFGALTIIGFARPAAFYKIIRHDGRARARPLWLFVNLAGFALILAPLLFLTDGATTERLGLAFSSWIAGGMLASFGAVLALARPRDWMAFASTLGSVPIVILLISIFTPELTLIARDTWSFEPISQLTFNLVVATLDVIGVEAAARADTYTLTSGDFFIRISSQCSGVEGFALITLFLLGYMYLFRDELQFPNIWVLLPVGLALSFILNIVRIAALFVIGLKVSPTLAVNGFHSHAGWLMFSLLSLSLIGVAQTVPWFRRQTVKQEPLTPVRQDWNAALILPFAAFMGISLVLSTFFEMPEAWYALKVVAMAGALIVFLPLYQRLNWRLDPLSVVAGTSIGILWLILQSQTIDSPLQEALATMPSAVLVAWIAFRFIGTTVLVPLVEELFFRGYILERLDRGSAAWRLLALIVSTGLFAALHDKWILAACAGLVFGLLYLRSRNLTDPIAAHATSNLIIAIYAVATAQWWVI